MKTHIESVQIQPQIKVSQEPTNNKNIKNNEVILHSQNNKEVKFNYLPEDKVSVSIRNEEGAYTNIKQENLPKELEKLTSPESFHAFLKSAYVKATVMSDSETKVDIAQKGLGGGKKDGVWKGDKGGMFNAQGSQDGAIQGNNIKNKHLNAGHVGGGVSGKGKGEGKNDGTGAGVGAGVGVGKGGDQIGNNIQNNGVAPNFKVKGDVFKDGIIGKNKGIDYWSAKKK